MFYVTVKVYKITRFYISLLIIILRSYLVIINIITPCSLLILHSFLPILPRGQTPDGSHEACTDYLRDFIISISRPVIFFILSKE